MFLIAGLGNPGEQYAQTPHNLGFLVVERLAARHAIRMTRKECQALIGQGTIGQGTIGQKTIGQGSLGGKPVLLAKPQTFMNLSGVAVKPLLEKAEATPSELILIYDELDLPWGSLRIRPNGRAAGHNGIKDVIAKLGTQEFPRVRIGVHPGHPLTSGADYLLSRFSRRQTESLDSLLDLAADAIESIVAEGVEKSMTRFNGSVLDGTK